MMIFDQFQTLAQAESFARAAQEQTNEPSIICLNQAEFDKWDVFPYELHFPVVLVPRQASIRAERKIEKLVDEFGGEFAGT